MAQNDSGEKTEKASPKKKRDAREKGNVFKSHDMASAVMLAVMFGALKAGYSTFTRSVQDLSAKSLSETYVAEQAANVTSKSIMAYYKSLMFSSLQILMPIFIIAIIVGVAANALQTGPVFSTSKLKPDFSRINPIEGFKRMFSMNSIVELLKSLLKVVVMGYVIYLFVRNNIGVFLGFMGMDVGNAFSRVMSESFTMGIMIGIALIAFSAIDVLYQWWRYEKDLRMTKQEVKEENKELEGDPQIKGKIRQKQRRMSAMRMMNKLKEADVVVTNPDHYAVALRYKQYIDKAPVVVAKGEDYLAQRIKKTAAEYKIAVIENKPVARALYASCEIGDEIPPEMYQAIADILIYVYKTMNRDDRKPE